MVTSGQPQPRDENGDPLNGHPAWKSHPQQGWSPDFIPKLAGDALIENKVDQVITIENAEAMKWSKELARKEGIFVGITSGATFAGAMKIAEKAPKGTTILAMLPDTGERYLSTPLFGDVGVDMSEDEIAISKSTPSAQLAPAT